MDSSFLVWIKSFIEFAKRAFGTIQTPYQTYRKIALKPAIRDLLFIALLVLLYLTAVTLVRGGLQASPLFLTASFVKVGTAVGISYASMVFVFYLAGRVIGPLFSAGSTKTVGGVKVKHQIIELAVLWGYTLIPTVMWFLTMSLFYYLLPPPRTQAVWGQLASAFFIGLSIAILLWKMILYYLTLRFGLRFDLKRIAAVSAVLFPLSVLYAFGMYRLGIFRVPFL